MKHSINPYLAHPIWNSVAYDVHSKSPCKFNHCSTSSGRIFLTCDTGLAPTFRWVIGHLCTVLTHERQDDGRHLSGYRDEQHAPTGPRCSVPHECVDPPVEGHETPRRLTGTGAVTLRKPESVHDGMPPFRALSFRFKTVPSLCPDSCINNNVTGLNIPIRLHHIYVTKTCKSTSGGKWQMCNSFLYVSGILIQALV
jgi:hypothetical protein